MKIRSKKKQRERLSPRRAKNGGAARRPFSAIVKKLRYVLTPPTRREVKKKHRDEGPELTRSSLGYPRPSEGGSETDVVPSLAIRNSKAPYDIHENIFILKYQVL